MSAADGLELGRRGGFQFGRSVVPEFADLLFDVEGDVLCLVPTVDRFGALLVFLGVCFGIALGLFDFVVGKSAGTFDGDFLLLAGFLSLAETWRMPLASMSKVTSI